MQCKAMFTSDTALQTMQNNTWHCVVRCGAGSGVNTPSLFNAFDALWCCSTTLHDIDVQGEACSPNDSDGHTCSDGYF